MEDTTALVEKEKTEISENIVNQKSKKNPLVISIISLASLLSTVAIICIALIFYCSSARTLEIDEAPDYNFITENYIFNKICEIKTDLNEIDTSYISTYSIDFTFFRFIKRSSTLSIVDTTPPEITVKNVVATLGTNVTGNMFVEDSNDKTTVSVSIDKNISQLPKGKHDVVITAIDEGKNITEASAEILIIEPEVPLYFESDTPINNIEKILNSTFGKDISFNMPDQGECSKITIEGKDKEYLYYIDIEIDDIIAPTATIKSFDLVLGEKVTKDDIISDVFDHSEVTIKMTDLPDFEKVGEHTVNISITDEYDNTSDFVSYIRIHNINTEIDVEINSHNVDIVDKIFNDNYSKGNLSFSKEYFFSFLSIKETKITLKGKYNPIKIKVNVIDTVPPVLKLKYVEKIITSSVTPEEFVYICKDQTEVTYSFVEEPDTNATGTFQVTVAATDACGNVTTTTADLIVHADTVPPEIHGTKDITALIGREPDYMNGVYATDEISKYMDLKVDSSQVDINTVGVYPVVYSAIDQYKNKSELTVYITVKESIRVCLDVENIKQNPSLPNGCEVVSLAIALRYNGCDVEPLWLFNNYMPSSSINSNSDPWTTYMGDPTGAGLGCYAPCVIKTGNDYLSDIGSSLKVEDVSGSELSVYEEYINNGTPVIMWGTVSMVNNNQICRSWKADGKSVVWHYYSHCLVMIGYTEDSYIFCDPLRGIVEYSKNAVEKAFEINFRQACIIK